MQACFVQLQVPAQAVAPRLSCRELVASCRLHVAVLAAVVLEPVLDLEPRENGNKRTNNKVQVVQAYCTEDKI